MNRHKRCAYADPQARQVSPCGSFWLGEGKTRSPLINWRSYVSHTHPESLGCGIQIRKLADIGVDTAPRGISGVDSTA